ncbi:hypothetical protein TSH100_17600 [Azospirillum sp. TSH100]|uniref:hypothetical protein n=1 Tax=Azospirillum sp. TSH100 TaxID=652764 RepID=UPI000D611FE9|nr:hypothetical protein [Azospirillum sp. TSH100]PWC84643.1 hypothetical protein TSH100_17600 [Azospirillum sp. TSH100]QCG91009.1 hypothetical protein E6C72_24925 [Azospirillum sp. TSH100]
MGYSLKDLERAGQKLNDHLEERSRAQGEDAARRLIASTARGRGLWFILHVPAWAMIMASVGAVISTTLQVRYAVHNAEIPALLVSGFIATLWYRANFTREHPLISFILGAFMVPWIILTLAK